MNIRQAIEAELIPYTIPPAVVEKAMVDVDGDVDGLDTYTAANKQFVYRAAFAALRAMLAVKSVGEGNYSMTYDPDGLRDKMRAIAKVSGDQNLIDELAVAVPTISAPKVW